MHSLKMHGNSSGAEQSYDSFIPEWQHNAETSKSIKLFNVLGFIFRCNSDLTDGEKYTVRCVYLTFGENVLRFQLICYSCH